MGSPGGDKPQAAITKDTEDKDTEIFFIAGVSDHFF